MITNTLAVAAGAAVAGPLGNRTALAQSPSQPTNIKSYTNAEFYNASGKFLIDKAREAYFDMFRRFGYPISETLRKEMWILDFGAGGFRPGRHGGHLLAQPAGLRLLRP